MEEKTYIIQQEVFTKIKKFLKLKNFLYDDQISLEDNIKKLCVKKLCEVVGIKCDCNYKNKFFNYFASITGQALCELLNIPILIAEDNFRLFKYNGVNLVDKVKELLNNDFLEDAYIDVFQFLDKNKFIFDIQ
jgi:hypothetical protein